MTAEALLMMIRAAGAGDSGAFEEIMLATERRVAHLAWHILGDAEDVKEAMQETFLRLYRHLGKYDQTKDFEAWLCRITVNVCRDTLRRRKRRWIFEPLDESMPLFSGDMPADEDLARRDDLALLRRAIEALAPKERMAVILRDVEGLSCEEVGATLGSSASTVRVQVSRARGKLRNFIAAWRKKS